MSVFDSQHSYSDFAQSVKHKARYVFDEIIERFLQTVLLSSKGRKRMLPHGRVLWRAQPGDQWETVIVDGQECEDQRPLPPLRMRPLPISACVSRPWI